MDLYSSVLGDYKVQVIWTRKIAYNCGIHCSRLLCSDYVVVSHVVGFLEGIQQVIVEILFAEFSNSKWPHVQRLPRKISI
jgi:glucose-6-phosphate dehydrogenase assembly protein OpcA